MGWEAWVTYPSLLLGSHCSCFLLVHCCHGHNNKHLLHHHILLLHIMLEHSQSNCEGPEVCDFRKASLSRSAKAPSKEHQTVFPCCVVTVHLKQLTWWMQEQTQTHTTVEGRRGQWKPTNLMTPIFCGESATTAPTVHNVNDMPNLVWGEPGRTTMHRGVLLFMIVSEIASLCSSENFKLCLPKTVVYCEFWWCNIFTISTLLHTD